ncbi:MAG: hypothetical protein WCF93_00810 [Candidatus Moraniibacteriota bacterium]
MKKPSAAIVASVELANLLNPSENEIILKEWCLLLSKLSIYHSGFAAISGVEFFDQLSIASLPTPETVINFVANLDPILDAPDWLLSIVFEKNDSAHIEDWLFGEHNKEDEESVKTRFVDFLGFSGTWEEVMLKTVELNDFVVSISTIPPIPDSLRE